MSSNQITSIALEKLAGHPDNPNRMSKADFGRLKRNIERTTLYEPLIVRPCPGENGIYQLINGHHRFKALAELGHKKANCLIWNVDDEQTDILLTTLNRLSGSDMPGKKLALLKRLNKQLCADKLAKILPQTKGQIEKLINLKLPTLPKTVTEKSFAEAMVFFVPNTQKQIIDKAIAMAMDTDAQGTSQEARATKAQSSAAALVKIAEFFINHSRKMELKTRKEQKNDLRISKRSAADDSMSVL